MKNVLKKSSLFDYFLLVIPFAYTWLFIAVIIPIYIEEGLYLQITSVVMLVGFWGAFVKTVQKLVKTWTTLY